MKFPETEPDTYRMWVKEGWHDLILEELGGLLSFVRKCSISGLRVGEIREACFFGFSAMYNRKVWLYMNEIEFYNGSTHDCPKCDGGVIKFVQFTPEGEVDDPCEMCGGTGKIGEEELAREWELSGLERP